MQKQQALSAILKALGLALDPYPGLVADMVKIRSAALYLHAMQGVRRVLVTLLVVLLCALFFIVGLLFLHLAAYRLLMFGSEPVAWIILVAGAAECVLSLLAAWRLVSARHWLRLAARSNAVLEKYAHML